MEKHATGEKGEMAFGVEPDALAGCGDRHGRKPDEARRLTRCAGAVSDDDGTTLFPRRSGENGNNRDEALAPTKCF